MQVPDGRNLFSGRRRIWLVLLSILCVVAFDLLTIQVSWGEESLATLTNKTGTVLYKQKTREVEEISPNKLLYPGDAIHTSNDSTAIVLMKLDKTAVRLRERSTMQVLPPQEKRGFLLNLVRGALYFFSRGDSDEPSVETPYLDAGFKGTEVVITVGSNQTTIAVLNGTATVSNRWAQTNLVVSSREMAVAVEGHAPVKSQLTATNLVQWWLFYPAVIDADELVFPEPVRSKLTASLQAYRTGDLAAALTNYPGYPAVTTPETDEERIYLGALYLAEGKVESTEEQLNHLSSNSSLAQSLRWLISAVQGDVEKPPEVHTSASEWLGLSYYFQARHELDKALEAANRSVTLSTNFAFGWERVAELEFSFGRTAAAKAAVDRSLKLAPLNAQAHALNGFLLSADNHIEDARKEFDEAIRLDSSLGNGWLGRGLARIRTGDSAGGLADLKMAAVLEPNRSLLRSYLGKAYSNAGQAQNANEELTRAQGLDPNDPVPWLYSALEKHDENRINEAVDDLEKSIERNGNRAVYRSQSMLDKDLAARSANLAAIYREAGLTDVSVSEAAKAITSDYANYSAHLFLANSYNELRDPNLINLRYETATFSEYLIANLLSPVGGSKLSPYVSQQEYSKLFEKEGTGFSSATTYLSRGDWSQQASVYGWQKNTGYAVDVYYLSQNGVRPNNEFEQRAVSVQLKQQLTPHDSVYVQTIFSDSGSGDLRQLYDQRSADPNLRSKDNQTPNLFLGYHHEWSPEMHTLLLAGRLEDNFLFSTKNVLIPGVIRDTSGNVTGRVDGLFGAGDETFDSFRLHSTFDAYSVELQQIAQVSQHTLIAGVRFQSGEANTRSEQVRTNNGRFPPYNSVGDFVATQSGVGDLTRLSIYGYDQWRVLDSLWLTAGLSYDQLHYPANVNFAPTSNAQRDSRRVSPKAGIVWTPLEGTTVRGAFSRSLGGLFYDSSVRLEPVQIAGFNQAYRSLVLESVEGAIAGSKFQTFDLGLEQKFKSRTYAILRLQLLQSDASRGVGAFDLVGGNDAVASQLRQSLKYREESLTFSLNQLVGNCWSLGANYKLSDADLKTRYADLPQSFFPATHEGALLHTLDFHVIFNHPCGFFAEGQALWRGQSNFHDDSALDGDHFWQENFFAGYRFPRRHAEITLGLLNLTGQNYHLNPLNLYDELPRERTLVASLKLNF